MDDYFKTVDLTPEQFELEVKAMLEATGLSINEFAVRHREQLSGVDGTYEIDATVRFESIGVNFLVLVECKHQRDAVKREVVQILHDRIRSTGAHKGILFATARFQRGAIEYAIQHGIALVTICDGASCYVTKSYGPQSAPPVWANIPVYIGWMASLTAEGNESFCNVSVRNPEALVSFILEAAN